VTTNFECVGWDPREGSSSFVGEVWIRLPSGMIIRDIPIFQKNGRMWASNVSRPLFDKNGNVIKEATGKWRWVPVVTFEDDRVRKAFNNRVFEALLRAHPDALSSAGGRP
jgi:hypothetical protein